MKKYIEGIITDRTVRNWFIKFRSGDMTLKDESSLTLMKIFQRQYWSKIQIDQQKV